MHRSLLAFFILTAAFVVAADAPRIAPADAAKLIAEGKAVLVDVREPGEWKESGVAAPATLLPKSDFDADQLVWKPFLAQLGGRQVILYCRSGHRAGIVAAALGAKGIPVANLGGLKDWIAAGLPVRKPDQPPAK